MSWNTVMRWLVKGAIWAAKHPDEVKAAVDAVKTIKGKDKPEEKPS